MFSGSSAEPRSMIPLIDTLPPADSARNVYEARNVDIEASFKGGLKGWWKFLERNLNPNVPVENGAPAGQYIVLVQFIVKKDGKLIDIKGVTNHGYGMEEEAVRILRKSPPWEPAMKNGRAVAAYYRQSITFQITEETDARKKKRKG